LYGQRSFRLIKKEANIASSHSNKLKPIGVPEKLDQTWQGKLMGSQESKKNFGESKHILNPQTSQMNSISVPAIGTEYGIIIILGIKTPYNMEKAHPDAYNQRLGERTSGCTWY